VPAQRAPNNRTPGTSIDYRCEDDSQNWNVFRFPQLA
jgi:hypothetical protein